MRFCVGECSMTPLLWFGANVVAGSSFGGIQARVIHCGRSVFVSRPNAVREKQLMRRDVARVAITSLVVRTIRSKRERQGPQFIATTRGRLHVEGLKDVRSSIDTRWTARHSLVAGVANPARWVAVLSASTSSSKCKEMEGGALLAVSACSASRKSGRSSLTGPNG